MATQEVNIKANLNIVLKSDTEQLKIYAFGKTIDPLNDTRTKIKKENSLRK